MLAVGSVPGTEGSALDWLGVTREPRPWQDHIYLPAWSAAKSADRSWCVATSTASDSPARHRSCRPSRLTIANTVALRLGHRAGQQRTEQIGS